MHYWEEFLKNKELINDWLDKAENLLKETQVDTKQDIDQRKKFFQQINENTFRNLVMTEKELRNYTPPESQVRFLIGYFKFIVTLSCGLIISHHWFVSHRCRQLWINWRKGGRM